MDVYLLEPYSRVWLSYPEKEKKSFPSFTLNILLDITGNGPKFLLVAKVIIGGIRKRKYLDLINFLRAILSC